MKLIFVYLLLPIISVSYSFIPPIHNNLLSYGRYCGAGPDSSFWNRYQPIDAFDSLCKQHDKDYDMCYNALQEQLGEHITIPTYINQIMALRGWLPFLGQIKSKLFGKYSNYLQCMHEADRTLIHSLQEKLASQQFPTWWNDLSQAPVDLLGIHHYPEACSFGIPAAGYCLVTSRDFFKLVITFFQASVNSDLPYLS